MQGTTEQDDQAKRDIMNKRRMNLFSNVRRPNSATGAYYHRSRPDTHSLWSEARFLGSLLEHSSIRIADPVTKFSSTLKYF